jgi:hypothetical protein
MRYRFGILPDGYLSRFILTTIRIGSFSGFWFMFLRPKYRYLVFFSLPSTSNSLWKHEKMFYQLTFVFEPIYAHNARS